MATDPFELYPVIAQIAAAFAGFGSLATGIGQHRAGDDTRVVAYRLGLMLVSSLSATLLGLLPATLGAVLQDEREALSLSAIAGFVSVLIYAPMAMRNARRIRRVSGFSMLAAIALTGCAFVALAAFALCAIGIPAGHGAGLYLLGLMGMLGSSVIMFARVIVSMLRPHSKAED